MADEKKSRTFAEILYEVLTGKRPPADPHICDADHVHGDRNTTYTVQIVGRHPAKPDQVFGLVAFDVTTDETGVSPIMNLHYGDGVNGLDVKREILLGNDRVWDGPWSLDTDRPRATEENAARFGGRTT